jgi:DNA-binding NarL/FixJ family response regulator
MTTVSQIVVVDDHPIMQDGVKLVLTGHPDLKLIGTADNGDDATTTIELLQPDLLILDLKMPGSSPFVVIAETRIRSPHTKILIMSAFDDAEYIRRLRLIGIDGYILKDEAPELLVNAVRTILQGATWFSHKVFDTMLLLERQRHQEYQTWEHLTERQQGVLIGLGKGWSNKQIALELHLAEQTVRNYTSLLYEKLGIESRAHAVIWFYEQALEHKLAGTTHPVSD